MALYWPKKHNKPFFARRAKKALVEDRSPPQELEVGPRSGPFLLVIFDFISKIVYYVANSEDKARYLNLSRLKVDVVLSL